ncbi:TetR/AcrR family transcriptional regulator [Paraliobacillus salinarum]|uniref:TetR/AcrR family transcriptional regulator n=1 Tax=Paraliobacillus salinarum TaxID=1158996 RepID=UPI001FE818FB|nr:TetR/AcrR family transcriptional regulator [Paraliobacillus salinarum]
MLINDTFENLDLKKKNRIINAALQEFSEEGYERASTNRIVKAAGIGKGMLFYYFQNKQSLYHYLLNYSLDLTLNDFLDRIDTSEKDFINRMYQIARLKVKLFAAHPSIMYFLSSFMLEKEITLPDDINEKFHKLQTLGYSKMYEDIDYSLFRQDIDPAKAFQLIQWSIDGYQEELKQRLIGKNVHSIHFEQYWQEFYDYLSVLRTAFYHKEEGKYDNIASESSDKEVW